MELNTIYTGNNMDILQTFDDNSIDQIVTDPPYELGFMGKKWDSSGIQYNIKLWEECLRVLKPGGHMIAFGGSRTFHRLAVAIEDAGFELRDTIMWVYGCLSEDTEILTEQGWKNKNTIKPNDVVFSLDLKKHKIIKSKVNYIFEYEYTGNLINLKNSDTDQLITPNHKVINKKGIRKQKSGKRNWYNEENWVYSDAWQIISDYYTIPLSSTYDGDYSIGGDMAELIGWIISEGNFQKDTNAINIYQSSVNKNNVERIRYCLNRLGIKHTEYQRNRTYKNRSYIEYQWYISGEYANKIKEIIPNNLPTLRLLDLKLSEKERLITGLCGGDGSINNNGKCLVFYQNNIETLEWFQILLHLTGKQGKINKNKMSCSINYSDSTQIQRKHYKNRQIPYTGIVWCINTEIGNFMARRNGKIFITGNSGFPKSHDISKAIDKISGAERKVIGKNQYASRRVNPMNGTTYGYNEHKYDISANLNVTAPATPEAQMWEGWGTSLKPAFEPIILARKPISEKNISKNVLKWGTGGINIDACRIETRDKLGGGALSGSFSASEGWDRPWRHDENVINKKISEQQEKVHKAQNLGRWPSNLIHDGSDEVIELFPETKSGFMKSGTHRKMSDNPNKNVYGKYDPDITINDTYGDSGSAARFFYCAKQSTKERNIGLDGIEHKQTDTSRKEELIGGNNPYNRGQKPVKNNHPTVKPIKLMEYLVKLITPPNGIVLDPFGGSGTTQLQCIQNNVNYVLIELNSEYVDIQKMRIEQYKELKQQENKQQKLF